MSAVPAESCSVQASDFPSRQSASACASAPRRGHVVQPHFFSGDPCTQRGCMFFFSSRKHNGWDPSAVSSGVTFSGRLSPVNSRRFAGFGIGEAVSLEIGVGIVVSPGYFNRSCITLQHEQYQSIPVTTTEDTVY